MSGVSQLVPAHGEGLGEESVDVRIFWGEVDIDVGYAIIRHKGIVRMYSNIVDGFFRHFLTSLNCNISLAS